MHPGTALGTRTLNPLRCCRSLLLHIYAAASCAVFTLTLEVIVSLVGVSDVVCKTEEFH